MHKRTWQAETLGGGVASQLVCHPLHISGDLSAFSPPGIDGPHYPQASVTRSISDGWFSIRFGCNDSILRFNCVESISLKKMKRSIWSVRRTRMLFFSVRDVTWTLTVTVIKYSKINSNNYRIQLVVPASGSNTEIVRNDVSWAWFILCTAERLEEIITTMACFSPLCSGRSK